MKLWTVLTDACRNVVTAPRVWHRSGAREQRKDPESFHDPVEKAATENPDQVAGTENSAITATTLTMMALPGPGSEAFGQSNKQEGDAQTGDVRARVEACTPGLDRGGAETPSAIGQKPDDLSIPDAASVSHSHATPGMLIQRLAANGRSPKPEKSRDDHEGAVIIAFPTAGDAAAIESSSELRRLASAHGLQDPRRVMNEGGQAFGYRAKLDLRADLLSSADGQDNGGSAYYRAYLEKLLGLERSAAANPDGSVRVT